MNVQTSISILLLVAGSEVSPQRQSELVVYHEALNWVDIAFVAIFLVILLPALFWALLRLKTSMSQQSIAIDSNNESIRVNKEAIRTHAESIEMSRETNRLLEALNDTLRRKSDSSRE
ncbi:MAG: hypothetical protein WKF77_25635 [Planctomycetaceae bacterium]